MHDGVEEADEGYEGEEHDGYVEGQPDLRRWKPRAMAPMKFSFLCSSLGGMWTVPAVAGTSVSGTSIFATSMVPGAVMMTGGEQVFGADAEEDVGGHDSAGDVGAMPEVMMVVEPGAGWLQSSEGCS